MSPALLLILQGITLVLPGVQALTCQSGRGQAVKDVSDMPLHWTVTNQQTCEDGWGCQDTMILTVNEGCQSAAELPCPEGSTHCYNGILLIRGGCNLLNNAENIGALTVSENCDLKGCSEYRTPDSGTVTVYSQPPGMLVASYARFCSSD
ncbi:hypothetical protein HPG69_009174, partial [Diceros bicornis minor]